MNDKKIEQLGKFETVEADKKITQGIETVKNNESKSETETASLVKKTENRQTNTGELNFKPKKAHKKIPVLSDPVTIKIEKVMESGLADEFKKLSPISQQEFKIKGENTALEIRNILKHTHIKAKSIFYLIVEWLRTLPGINKFFLEQEAKIKTDQIIELYQKEKDKTDNKLL